MSGFGSGVSLGLLRCQPTPQSPEACRVGTSVPVRWLTHMAIPLTLHCLITWISPRGCLSVFLTHGDHFPQFPKGEQGGSHSIFYDPVLEVIGILSSIFYWLHRPALLSIGGDYIAAKIWEERITKGHRGGSYHKLHHRTLDSRTALGEGGQRQLPLN